MARADIRITVDVAPALERIAALNARVRRDMERESRERWRARVVVALDAERAGRSARVVALRGRLIAWYLGARRDDTPLPLP